MAKKTTNKPETAASTEAPTDGDAYVAQMYGHSVAIPKRYTAGAPVGEAELRFLDTVAYEKPIRSAIRAEVKRLQENWEIEGAPTPEQLDRLATWFVSQYSEPIVPEDQRKARASLSPEQRLARAVKAAAWDHIRKIVADQTDIDIKQIDKIGAIKAQLDNPEALAHFTRVARVKLGLDAPTLPTVDVSKFAKVAPKPAAEAA